MTAMVSDLRCDADGRRAELLARRAAGSAITGIDYLEVRPSQRVLDVYMIGDQIPAGLVGRPDRIRILGGRRVQVRVTDVTTSTAGGRLRLVVQTDQPGDFSDYVLEIERRPELDELFRRCSFNFKVGCPSRFDCRPPTVDDQADGPAIDIDYMAKDYASFRQALVDLIDRLSPEWTERLAADLGMTVLELLAYVADQLSYFQDAVANEAFLATARQRISVRRHARLVDYQLHDGASARTFVHLQMAEGASHVVDAHDPSLELLTWITGALDSTPPGPIIAEVHRERAFALAGAVFTTSGGARLDARLNRIDLHDWGDDCCCLPVGATSVELVGSLTDVLAPGDLLLFEEVRDPSTGDETLADPAHRQVVRLVDVEGVFDNLLTRSLTRVRWQAADALTFPLCVTGSGEENARVERVSVARGNMLVADHGRPVRETGRHADPVLSGARAVRFVLGHGPLSWRLPVPSRDEPASRALEVDPLGAKPMVSKVTVSGTFPPDDWSPVSTLIGSDRFDHVVAVETGNDGRAMLRFGDDVFGMSPPEAATFDVDYRVGVGPEANVGAEAIHHLIGGAHVPNIAAIRNPLPAWGGTEPESAARAKQIAPAAFRASQLRAVTEADYAAVTARHRAVRNAVARFRWTGSWHTVFISVDPSGRLDLPPEQAAQIRHHVERFSLAGYDIEIVAPHYVPLQIDLEICVGAEHFRPDVEQAVRRELSSSSLPGRRRGFFHPDNFTFGQPLYLSRLYEAVAAVDGVDSVVATRFARLAEQGADLARATAANLDRGAIPIGRLEVLRLDDDPDFPDNGLLGLTMRGGK